jgi:hypothetical protein
MEAASDGTPSITTESFALPESASPTSEYIETMPVVSSTEEELVSASPSAAIESEEIDVLPDSEPTQDLSTELLSSSTIPQPVIETTLIDESKSAEVVIDEEPVSTTASEQSVESYVIVEAESSFAVSESLEIRSSSASIEESVTSAIESRAEDDAFRSLETSTDMVQELSSLSSMQESVIETVTSNDKEIPHGELAAAPAVVVVIASPEQIVQEGVSIRYVVI